MAQEYKPGDVVPASGIYNVVHDPEHVESHQVTCIKGKIFPPCRGCHHPRFTLAKAAHHIENHEQFRTW